MKIRNTVKKVARTLDDIALYTTRTISIAGCVACVYIGAIGCGADLPIPHNVRYENEERMVFEPIPVETENRIELLRASLGALGPLLGIVALTYAWKGLRDIDDMYLR
jgi:hypothetical protein